MMCKVWRGLVLALTAVAVVGCGSGETPAPEPVNEGPPALKGEGTELVLHHSGLPNATRRDQHAGGWALYLGRLEARFGSGRC